MSSGQVVVGKRNGGGQNFNWMISDTGSGYTVTASDFTVGTGLESGFVCTNGGEVFRTDDGATSWSYLGYDRSQTSYSAIMAEECDRRQVYVGGDSGRLLRRDCGCGNWTPTTAGSKRVYSLEADNNGEHYLGAGGSGRVYERSEDGAGWNVGIPNSQVGIYDVISYRDSDDDQFVYAAAGGGFLYWMNCNCDTWTPIGLGTKKLTGVTHDMEDNLLVCGSSSTICEKIATESWQPMESPVQADFNEAIYGRMSYENDEAMPDVIVGTNGKIVERVSGDPGGVPQYDTEED